MEEQTQKILEKLKDNIKTLSEEEKQGLYYLIKEDILPIL